MVRTHHQATIAQHQFDFKELRNELRVVELKYTNLERHVHWQAHQLQQQHEQATASHLELQELGKMRVELKAAKEEKVEIAEALEKCKTQIFAMQPDDNISDTDVKQKYLQLREAITTWVDSELGDATGYLEKASADLLGNEGFGYFDRALLSDMVSIVSGFPDLEAVFAEMVVRQYLDANVFGNSMRFLGLRNHHKQCVDEVERAVNQNKRSRDEQPFCLLSAKVYKALLEDDLFVKRRDRAIKKLAEDLCNMFKKLLGDHGAKPKPGHCLRLVGQAAELADLMRSSSAMYKLIGLVNGTTGEKISKIFSVKPGITSMFEVVDARTEKRVRECDEPAPGNDGLVGQVIAVMDPGLKRCGDAGRRVVVLIKPKVMVAFCNPVTRNKKNKETGASSKESSSSV